MIYRKVVVVPYNPNWPDLFRQEANKIEEALSKSLKKIHHIGSTAVPGMPAKPVIDMILECNDIGEIEKIKQALQQLDYLQFSRQVIPHRSFFSRKRTDVIDFHLHIYEQGDPQIKRHVNFRDYMISHSDDAKKYADLKLNLAKEFSEDINNYVIGKDKLVQEIDTKAKLWPERRHDYLPSKIKNNIREETKDEFVKAITANLNIMMTYFAQYLTQVELTRIPGYTIVSTGLVDATFNYILDADFMETIANDKIIEVTDYFKNKNVPFSWWISPYDKPDQLPTLLVKNGYQHIGNNVALYFDLVSWDIPSWNPSQQLKIIRALDEKTLHDFALILANDRQANETYFKWIAAIITNDDPIEYYVGYINDKPVVRSLTCYYAGIAGIYWLSTTPDERKKDYAITMQAYQLKCAKEQGYSVAIMHTSDENCSLYQRLGYTACSTFNEFKLRPQK